MTKIPSCKLLSFDIIRISESSDFPNLIEDEVTSVRERFDDICTILEARGMNLDTTLNQSEKYQTAYNEITMWLESAESVQQQQEPISNNLEMLRKQLMEQRVSCLYDYNLSGDSWSRESREKVDNICRLF